MGIAVTGVTKAVLGEPQIAEIMMRAGVTGLGDARVENVERMRAAGLTGPITLLRAPMLSQVKRVVACADASLNSEIAVIKALSAAAQSKDCIHGIVLMLETGDLREGVMPQHLLSLVEEMLQLPHLQLHGLGTNLACRSGVVPDDANMGELSGWVAKIEAAFGLRLARVSGGNSANLDWAFHTKALGRVNELRLGESILLGCDPLNRAPIQGLFTDAFTLVAEVIESMQKPSMPWGTLGQSAFPHALPAKGQGTRTQSILALGHQDTDPWGLTAPLGLEILGASSDHLVVDSQRFPCTLGQKVTFQLNYSALVRAMTSPYVAKSIEDSDFLGLTFSTHEIASAFSTKALQFAQVDRDG